ncbi:DUF1178 family protein [Pseudaestuariivita rosea]|uniref:DUF1178 family protein n=1 Tax=Pseudaestuariivita rosea TaxID=2763263 RepID=UPI001ABA290B|nr:DUF1178 family protein [Pseudaestuariivita rosea]
MIRYALKCDHGHSFVSWFQSATAFDTLKSAGHLACAICGSDKVEKTLMAPRIGAASEKTETKVEAPLSEPASPTEQAVTELRKHLETNSEYVGMNFAAEARKMHEGDSQVRSIHGEAKPDEAKKLLEDGIPVAPLPFIPTRKTN